MERTDNGRYTALQQQRALERDIRRHREREAAALDPAGLKEARRGTRAAQARMKSHLAEHPDLLRRAHREQLGAGNVATDAQVARFRDEAVDGLPDAPRAPLLSELRVAQLRDRMRAAYARGDERAADRYAGERVRRDQALTRRRKRRIAARDGRGS